MANKNKTNKSVKKRVKVTATGKLKYAKVGRRHLNAHMNAKRKRNLRRGTLIATNGEQKNIKRLLQAS
jgi:large subunit ribosomal protein L35